MKPRAAARPNYTQIPNEWFDKWLREVETDAENKVVQIVMRFTFGWHDYSAGITITQFQELTGLSRSAVVEGIKAAIKHGFVEREVDGHGRIYRMRTLGAITAGLKTKTQESGVPTLQESGIPTLNSSKSLLFQSESNNVLKKKKKKGRKTGNETLIPEEMRTLSDEMLSVAKRAVTAGLNIEDEHESFVARADRDSLTYISWSGAWRTWLANAIKFKRERDERAPAQQVTVQPQKRAPLHEQMRQKS